MTGNEAPLSSTQEDYLEAILRLVHEHGRARVGDVASVLGVHKSSVTAALQLLRDKGLVHYRPYAGVVLTERGRVAADRVARNHAAIRAFLRDVLCVPDEAAERNACRMEHAVDGDVLERLSGLAEQLRAWRRSDAEGWGRFMRNFRRRLRRSGARKNPA